ncbi:DUF2970 domain-containing protein [Pigmentiphaga litoralis]|uniref:DUF2970 domain-containing protein n=1 Tax=Pigmentiphaga litoralis TaxID=516702 RepID=UPI003B42E128
MTEPRVDARATARKLNFFQTVQAVLWSFIGLRRGKDYQQDMANLNPVHLVIAGVLMAALLVLVLVGIVQAVVA